MLDPARLADQFRLCRKEAANERKGSPARPCHNGFLLRPGTQQPGPPQCVVNTTEPGTLCTKALGHGRFSGSSRCPAYCGGRPGRRRLTPAAASRPTAPAPQTWLVNMTAAGGVSHRPFR